MLAGSSLDDGVCLVGGNLDVLDGHICSEQHVVGGYVFRDVSNDDTWKVVVNIFAEVVKHSHSPNAGISTCCVANM